MRGEVLLHLVTPRLKRSILITSARFQVNSGPTIVQIVYVAEYAENWPNQYDFTKHYRFPRILLTKTSSLFYSIFTILNHLTYNAAWGLP